MLPPQWRVSRMISNTLSLAQSVHSVKLLYIRILFSHLYWCLPLAHLWLNTSYLLWSSIFPSSVVFMSIISFFNVANLLHLSLFIYLFQQLTFHSQLLEATIWFFFLLSDHSSVYPHVQGLSSALEQCNDSDKFRLAIHTSCIKWKVIQLMDATVRV